MRLTNKAREELRAALRSLERARTYLDDEKTIVGRLYGMRSMNEYWRDGEALSPVAKWHGSDLCGLDTGIEKLAGFLARH